MPTKNKSEFGVVDPDFGSSYAYVKTCYCLSKDELIELLTDAIHWGVGTYQYQLQGGSPTNTQIQYYLSEKLSQ